VGEVNEAKNAVDHRVTESDKGVDRAEGEAVDELLKDLAQGELIVES
jgi:hypothetical protein